MSVLARKYCIAFGTYHGNSRSVEAADNGPLRCDDRATGTHAFVTAWQHVSRVGCDLRANPALPDVSIASLYESHPQVAQLPPAARRWADYCVAEKEQYYGTPLGNMSCRHFGQGGTYGGREEPVNGGYGTIVQREVQEAVAKGCMLLLGDAVTAIRQCASGALEATLASGRALPCSHAIVTAPLGVLKAQGIAFSPPLPPAHLQAINAIGTASFSKVMLEFEEPFWDDDVGTVGVCGEMRGWLRLWLVPFGPCGPPVLLCIMGGTAAAHMERLTDGEIQSESLRVLQTAFPKPLPPVTRFVCTRWNANPYTRCAFSSYDVGTEPHHFATLAKPAMGGRLVLAGEHTDVADYCSVHGAHNSGLRAAGQVLQDS